MMRGLEHAVGLVPAAGKGVRLGLPYPKELYPVIRENRYKPVAQFVLDNLVVSGVRDVVFVINETKAQLVGYFGGGRRFGCRVAYAVQEPLDGAGPSSSPGLAHALDAAHHLIEGRTVCFGMADTIMEPGNVFARAAQAAAPDDDVVLVLFPTTHPEKFGMVCLDDEQRVIEVVDKPSSTTLTLMWGCILWRPSFTALLHEQVGRGVADFAAILNGAIANGLRVRGVPIVDGTYADLGTYQEIVELDATLRQA